MHGFHKKSCVNAECCQWPRLAAGGPYITNKTMQVVSTIDYRMVGVLTTCHHSAIIIVKLPQR